VSMPLWAIELANEFWNLVGEPEEPPRDLRIAIARALPVTIVTLPRLRIGTVGAWLQQQGIPCELSMEDRSLRAVLVAKYGHGIILLDGSDLLSEQRFSIAHELAHFLRHYWSPRSRMVNQFGPTVLEVLDGERPPRYEERVHALLARTPIGFFIHLLSRIDYDSVDIAEREADLLAFELLAPSADILEADSAPATVRREAMVRRLTTTHGFPEVVAHRYIFHLLPESPRSGSLIQWLAEHRVELSGTDGEEKLEGPDRKVRTRE
jgi:Zn-dependent peptidase ImmA (M78 family)